MSESASSKARQAKLELLRLLTEKARRAKRRKLFTLYPDTGPLRRELYAKHLRFFGLGLTHEERLFLAANRIGKTEGAGGYELTLHLTGLYPEWWPGYRFTGPVDTWAAGATALTTRDIIQTALLGPVGEFGTGLIPGEHIRRHRPKAGVPDAVDTAWIAHASGGVSRLGLKSYDQGRRAFEGTKKHVVWFDEEPPIDVYGEGLMRTMSTVPGERGGLVLCTFTPMEGMSATVMHFLPDGLIPEAA